MVGEGCVRGLSADGKLRWGWVGVNGCEEQ
jgi:hypothetical protein